MQSTFSGKLVRKLTRATSNQLKYWVKIGIVCPNKASRTYLYSFKDIIKLRVLVSLKSNGLSLQRLRQGLANLSEILPNDEEPLSSLIIHTDGIDMIVAEKGKYFSAITRQRYLRFDTAKIKADIIKLQRHADSFIAKSQPSKQGPTLEANSLRVSLRDW